MIKVKVTYASAFDLSPEEIELATGSAAELQERVIKKLGESALFFASQGNLILDPSTMLSNDQEIFIFPNVNGG